MCKLCLIEDTSDGVFTLSKKQKDTLYNTMNVEGIVSDAINQLYDDRKIDAKTKKELFKTHYEPLKQAVNEGYGGTRIEYGTPNYEFLKQLQTNTAVFAMFKSHASMKEMAALLKDADGNLRSKQDYINEAKKIDATYRTQYLDVEYDTATRQARMASQWQKFVKNKRIYPNLKYLLSKAAKPDEKHLKYVGIIAPVDSPFWNSHYPPNRWRCQCSVEQTDDEATDIPGDLPPVPPEFAFNSGKTGQIFDLKNSEYIKSIPPKEQPALIRDAKKQVDVQAAQEAPYQVLYKSKKGADVKAHPLAFDNSDFNEVVQQARTLANNGNAVKVLPDVNDPALRQQLLPQKGIKGTRNPDYLINDDFIADLKTLDRGTKKAVHGAFSRCKEQCDNIVLNVEEAAKISSKDLNRYVKGKLSHADYASFDNVWIIYNGKLYKTNRQKIVQMDEWPVKAK